MRGMQMDPETKEITPVDYLGVKCVSFGYAGQGSAIMRGPMVSGLIQQLVLTSKWGELDYLVVDFPPGTGSLYYYYTPTSSPVIVSLDVIGSGSG